MATTSDGAWASHEVRPERGRRLRPEHVLLVGALLQAAAGVAWASGRHGLYPFGSAGAVRVDVSVFAGVDPVTVGLGTIAVALLAGTTAVLTVTRTPSRGAGARTLHASGWVVIAGLVLFVPDVRLLTAVAYTPILAVGAPFGWPEGASIATAWPWEVSYLGLTTAWGLAWAATLIRRQRWATAPGPHAGSARARPASAARWGRPAVAVAVAIPMLYAATRWAWALGIPLGISEEVLAEGAETGLWWAGAALGTLAVLGAGLTLGLIRHWGEVVPAWVPGVGGRTVPVALATIPAGVVAVLVTSAGLAFVRLLLAGAFQDFFAGSGWAVLGPELLWPLWGVALGAATLAYHLRRRGPAAD